MRFLLGFGLLIAGGSAAAQAPRLTPLTRFGCESCEGPLLFTRIQALTIAPDRRVVVIDRSEPNVRVFDASGRVERAFGRTGQGPAELQTPMSVSVAPDGSVEVVDMTRRRLIRFGSRGEDRGAVALGGFANIGAFAPRGGHALVAITAPGSPVLELLRVTGDKPVRVLQVGDKDFPERPSGNIEALSVAVSPDGSFVIGDGAGAYVIRRYRADGTPNGEFRRAIPKVRRTAEEIRVETERRAARIGAMQRRGSVSPGSMRLPQLPPERDYFEAGALRFDDRGRLWVLVERGAAGHTVLDVFDPAGRYLGEVDVPAEFREYALGAGLLAAVVPDDLGVERVQLWTITEPVPGK